jgi:hypothetical protein
MNLGGGVNTGSAAEKDLLFPRMPAGHG